VACNLSFIIKNKRVLKVTGSHVHFKSSVLIRSSIKTLKQQSTHRK